MWLEAIVGLLVVGGLAVAVEGGVAWWRKPRPRGNLAWMRAFRAVVFGVSMSTVGAGLWLGWPVLIFFGLIVAVEETIETSICVWALRQEDAEASR